METVIGFLFLLLPLIIWHILGKKQIKKEKSEGKYYDKPPEQKISEGRLRQFVDSKGPTFGGIFAIITAAVAFIIVGYIIVGAIWLLTNLPQFRFWK